MNRRPIQGVHGCGMGVHAHSAPVWWQCRAPKVNTSAAIHRCHAYGIVQGRLLHAYATPMIFNWVWMTPKSTSINGVTRWLEQLDFCLNRCKWEKVLILILITIFQVNCIYSAPVHIWWIIQGILTIEGIFIIPWIGIINVYLFIQGIFIHSNSILF